MGKRGQADIVVGGILLIGLIIFSGISGYKVLSENRYVGDKTAFLYYDLSKCDIKDIPKEDIISFNNLEEANKNGYQPAKCSL